MTHGGDTDKPLGWNGDDGGSSSAFGNCRTRGHCWMGDEMLTLNFTGLKSQVLFTLLGPSENRGMRNLLDGNIIAPR